MLSFGEILWDVFPQEEHLGGAPLNFSAAMQRLGDPVLLLTAVGSDLRGECALKRMRAMGLSTELVQVIPGEPTGTAIVTKDPSGNAAFVIQRPAAFDLLSYDEPLISRVTSLHPEWIYFGTLTQTRTSNEAMLQQMVPRIPGVRCYYDMNLREGHWNLPLVQRLSTLATVIKLNESEAETLFRLTGGSADFSLERFCRQWSATYDIQVMCVTLGSKGCAILSEDAFQTFAGFPAEAVDTVGAGDAFAAAFLHGLHRQWSTRRIAEFANALGAIVAGRAGAIPDWNPEEIEHLIANQRGQPLRT